jgi:hypothetical protein
MRRRRRPPLFFILRDNARKSRTPRRRIDRPRAGCRTDNHRRMRAKGLNAEVSRRLARERDIFNLPPELYEYSE